MFAELNKIKDVPPELFDAELGKLVEAGMVKRLRKLPLAKKPKRTTKKTAKK